MNQLESATEKLTENVTIRKAELKDYDELLEILVKFYTTYERLCVHMKITDQDIREMVRGRLNATMKDGICSVAVINGKIEGVFNGIMHHRHDPHTADFHHLSERVYAIEGLCEALTADLWDRVPPKFNTVCQLAYGLVTPKAQRMRIGEKLLAAATQMCYEKGVYVMMSECLVDKTARWMNNWGFVVVNSIPLDQWMDKKGHPYFHGLPDKSSVLLLAFLDNTMDFKKDRSKL